MFTERFSTYIQSKGISAYSIAKQTGISQGLMNEYKNGIKLPTIVNLVKIADYLGVSIDYLLGRSSSPEIHDPIFEIIHETTTTHNLDRRRNQITQNN